MSNTYETVSVAKYGMTMFLNDKMLELTSLAGSSKARVHLNMCG